VRLFIWCVKGGRENGKSQTANQANADYDHE
jgi:hypothetical protein